MLGKEFVSYWMHNGMMQLSGAKMSKSVGNLVTVDSFLEKYEPDVLRMMILNSSYRGPLTFNEETIEHAQKALKRLRSGLRPSLPKDEWKGSNLAEKSNQLVALFQEAMDDDFNSAGALGHIFDFVKDINQARDEGADQDTLQEAQNTLRALTAVFGLNLDLPPAQVGEAGLYIDLLIEVREKLREQKLWELSDLIRDKLEELDVILEDTSQGTSWHIK
jgi:cysteinyl-tRNA synthetase